MGQAPLNCPWRTFDGSRWVLIATPDPSRSVGRMSRQTVNISPCRGMRSRGRSAVMARSRRGLQQCRGLAAGEARDHWEGQADAWIDLTRSDPDYELFNKPSFLDLVPPPAQLTVDLGCGEGRLTRELLGLGHRVVALDGSATLATTAKAMTPPVTVGLAD